MPEEEQGEGRERMGQEEDIGCQRKVRDPEREWGIQGTESWKEERKNKKKKK